MLRRLAALIALFGAVACSSNEENQKAKQRLWGRNPAPTKLEAAAEEPIDAGALDRDDKVLQRVLKMQVPEAYQRFGFFEYRGVARLSMDRDGKGFEIEETSLIERGLHGDFRVVQTGRNDRPLREAVHHNGILFIANGGGKMRVQGVVQNQDELIQREAWEPLQVYAAYYGERFGVKMAGGQDVNGRPAVKYTLVLKDGPELIDLKNHDTPKRPKKLSGEILVDQKTGVIVKAKFRGTLEVPVGKDSETKPGVLELALDSEVKSIEGKEIKPGEYVPTIQRHPTDLEPLAFLKGKTKTSTTIGGQKKPAAKTSEKTPEKAVEDEKKPVDAKKKKKKPAKKKKKKKKKKPE